MKTLAPLLALLVLGCTDDPVAPQGLYPSYFLISINGRFLPAPDGTSPDDAVVTAASLAFDPKDRPRGGPPGLAVYTRWLERAGQPAESVTIERSFSMNGDEIRIDLCAPGELCITTTELVGHLDGSALELTHYLGGIPGSVFRFMAALPD